MSSQSVQDMIDCSEASDDGSSTCSNEVGRYWRRNECLPDEADLGCTSTIEYFQTLAAAVDEYRENDADYLIDAMASAWSRAKSLLSLRDMLEIYAGAAFPNHPSDAIEDSIGERIEDEGISEEDFELYVDIDIPDQLRWVVASRWPDAWGHSLECGEAECEWCAEGPDGITHPSKNGVVMGFVRNHALADRDAETTDVGVDVG
ncbi:hypothetical protein H2203_001384 [Taxawa tesnikishii (nom. ined.)]|nr:hypothetical protein H2203_001384 [Dothideales sp. JES 119]